jgi:hypothetical protein
LSGFCFRIRPQYALCISQSTHTPPFLKWEVLLCRRPSVSILNFYFDLPLCDLAPDLEGEVLVVPLQDVSLLPAPKSKNIRTTTKVVFILHPGIVPPPCIRLEKYVTLVNRVEVARRVSGLLVRLSAIRQFREV